MTLVDKSNITSPYVATEKNEAPQTVSKCTPVFGMRIVTAATEQNTKSAVIKEIQQVMSTWCTAISAREEKSKKLVSSYPGEFSYSEMAQEDKDVVVTYGMLISSMAADLDIVSQGISNTRTLLVLHDGKQRIQAIAPVEERVNSLYIDTLLSAAWNIPMNGNNTKAYRECVVKGAGTTLMRQIYELAKMRKKEKIELTPARSSEGFYDSHLHMKRKLGSVIRYFDVKADSIPAALQVTSGNLLS